MGKLTVALTCAERSFSGRCNGEMDEAAARVEDGKRRITRDSNRETTAMAREAVEGVQTILL